VPDKKDFYQREMDEIINNPIFSMSFKYMILNAEKELYYKIINNILHD